MPLKTLSGKHADPRKGRGSGINPEGRFENETREAFDDGWAQPEDEPRALKTQVTDERARTIIARNDSPDIPFSQSINPYSGCEHGCVYCLAGDTRILMGDGRTRMLADLRQGDEIYGTVRVGWYRRYVKTRVLAHWSVVKPAYRVTLEDGTSIVAGPDHRFLTERGWKFVAEHPAGRPQQRPVLTVNNKLMGTGAFAMPPAKERDYRAGYLCGLIRGDGAIGSYHCTRVGRTNADQHCFRLALCDDEALTQASAYLQRMGIRTDLFVYQRATDAGKAMNAIRASARLQVQAIRELIAWPTEPSQGWALGFLAGIFDAEGSYSDGIVRISNTDREIVSWISRCLQSLSFTFVIQRAEPTQTKPIDVLRLTGGLREHLRLFHSIDPAITRKRNIEGQAVKSQAKLRVVSVESLGKAMRLYDIQTGTEDFIANGLVSHNCYARPSHAYRNLSPGIDFETRIFAKINAPELLRTELSKPGYRCELIALGSNTDPYQPAERSRRITRGILEVCAGFNQPVAIVTKNALVERDIDILAPMAARRLAEVFLSVTTLDHGLARRLEPRCSAPGRRLETVRALAQAGIPVGVMLAPVIPFINDHEIEAIVEAARAHGAQRAAYILMRLPFEVKALFRDWLERHYPLKAAHVMSRVHAMRGGRDNDPQFGSRMTGQGEFAELLKQRFAVACKRAGLNQARRGEGVTADTTRFRVPREAPPEDRQRSLF